MECFNCRWKRNPLSLESADSSYQTRLCLHEAQKRREILRRSCSVRVVFFFLFLMFVHAFLFFGDLPPAFDNCPKFIGSRCFSSQPAVEFY